MIDRSLSAVVVEEAPYPEEEYRRLVDVYDRLDDRVGGRVPSEGARRCWRVRFETGGRAECEADGTFVMVKRYLDDEEAGSGETGRYLRIWRVPEELAGSVGPLECARPDGVVVPEGWSPTRGWYDPDSSDLRRLRYACRRCLGRLRARNAA